MVTLHQSHDDLTRTLVEFADQILRGSHGPTGAQWLAVAGALRGAAVHIDPTTAAWAVQVADQITQKVGGA